MLESLCGNNDSVLETQAMLDSKTLLDCFNDHVKETPDKTFMTQPMGGGLGPC